MFPFYTLRKCQKTFDFLTFLGGIEMEHWLKWIKEFLQNFPFG